MKIYDVFNGDADGICALHQLRLAEPTESILVTGVKRDIKLLQRVNATDGDIITVLDVSLDKNRSELLRVLEEGAQVRYFDHHFAGEIPHNNRLEVYIDTAPEICTSLLVNNYLNGKYLSWAVTAAFGDNLIDAAIRAAKPLELHERQLSDLRKLGICINYNGYGSQVKDLFFPPDDLYHIIQPYNDPFAFISDEPAYQVILEGYEQDMMKAELIKSEISNTKFSLYILPEEAWARRVSGVFANKLAQADPEHAHALLTRLPDSGYQVSIRAPLSTKSGADKVCRSFPSGGGRNAAAGINFLPDTQVDQLVQKMFEVFG
jgi:hypothetical protein